MALTLQRVDDRHQLSLPMFYPDYRPGCMKSTSSRDVQSFEGSARQPRSQSTRRDGRISTRRQRESSPSRVKETSLKSCLRTSSDKHVGNKENFKDSDNDRNVGNFKASYDDLASTAPDNRRKSPKRKWKRSTKVEHKDSVDDSEENSGKEKSGKEKSGNVKMKGFTYPRFRYPLRFHYGSVEQSKSRVISAVPVGFRTFSFYSNLPRRQRKITPGDFSSETKRRGKGDKRNQATKQSAEERTGVDSDRNSRPSSPERELNGVYHVVHEAETAQAQDNKAEEHQRAKTTEKDNDKEKDDARNSKDQPDDDEDNEALEVKENDAYDSSSLSSRSILSIRSEESIKHGGSSSDEERLKNDESGSSDDVDQRRSRRKGKSKNKKKTKKIDKIVTTYAADFEEDQSGVVSVD